MKSIKQKAEEFYPGHCNAYTDARNEDKRIGFEAGANYVLDEVEQVVQGDLNSHSAFKLKCLKQIVEELKK